MRIDTNNSMFSGASVGLGTSFVDRLQAFLQRPAIVPLSAGEHSEDTFIPSSDTWTSTMLRNQLLELGASVTDKNIGIADALTKVGIPISLDNLQAASNALGSARGTMPMSYALATAWSLPPTPAILKALTAVTSGLKPELHLPPDLVNWLGLALDAESDAETLGGQLHNSVRQVTRSTENKLLKGNPAERASASSDLRSILLKLAGVAVDKPTRHAASYLALHLEGQQLINQASAAHHSNEHPTPIYFSIPLQFQDQLAMLEMQIWQKEEPSDDDEFDFLAVQTTVRAVVRVKTKRLGAIEASILGTSDSSLQCKFTCEKMATTRLITRSTADLASAFVAAGWDRAEVTSATGSHDNPLWFGGEHAGGPRRHVDRRI